MKKGHHLVNNSAMQLVITLQFYEDLFGRFSVKKRQFLGGQRPPHNLWLSRGQLICLQKAFGHPRDPGVASGYQKVILVGNIRKIPAKGALLILPDITGDN